MEIRNILKLFVPPVIGIIWHKITVKKKNIQSPLPQIEHHSDKIVIIGNGPSLKDSVRKHKKIIVECDKIAVNFFASSELYEELMPNIYLFADPAFFKIPEDQRYSIDLLFKNIVEKTNWPMKIIVPLSAKGSASLSFFTRNNNIELLYYINYQQEIGKLTKFESWDKNLTGPPAQNVLNVALYLALFWNYNETYLIGADSSFLEDLRIDQETNEIYTVDNHFYNRNEVYRDNKIINFKLGRPMPGWTLHGLIYAYAKMFDGYFELKKYADYKGLSVYNASEYSWINVFERKKLE